MTLLSFIAEAFNFIVPLTILLGLLIFVHELGHFSVAKFFGVRVETFSIGFGKKIWKKVKGDTTYCLSLIPFGGYVKMYGDDPTANIPEEDKKYSFLHKPVGQRIAVVLAGPLMNFFFAILVFGLIAMVGEKEPLAVVGNISPNSAAEKMGFQAGDKILSINSKPVSLWKEAEALLNENQNSAVELEIQRYGETESIHLKGHTELIKNPDILSTKREVGFIPGLELVPIASNIGVGGTQSPASLAGLKTSYLVRNVQGEEIERWYELESLFQKALAESAPVLKIGYQENIKAERKWVEIPLLPSYKDLNDLGIYRSDLFIGEVMAESAAAKAGIQKGDHIVKINSQPVSRWNHLVEEVRAFTEDSAPIDISIDRSGEELHLSLSPTPVQQKDPITGKETTVYAIGVTTSLMGSSPPLTLVRVGNPITAIGKGVKDSIQWSVTTVLSFWKLLSNEVSANSIGGPIMIGQLASQSFQLGLSAFLKIMGIISINLFILNLLPLPVLDGGHLVFYTLEAIRGKPLNLRVLEVAQTFGLVLLLSLMVFATFNDISRSFGF